MNDALDFLELLSMMDSLGPMDGKMNLERIEGIYNLEIISHLRELGIKNWLFDFRPKSFSFIQQYKFLEILESKGIFADNIYLLFNREKKETLESFLDIVLTAAQKIEILGKIKLEFDEFLDNDDFDKYHMPYYLRINRHFSFEHFANLKYLEGLVLDFKILSNFQDSDEILFFSQNLNKFKEKFPLVNIVLSADWDSNIFHSLEELIKFNYLSMPINSKVETSYRHVDVTGLKTNSQYFLRNRNEHSA